MKSSHRWALGLVLYLAATGCSTTPPARPPGPLSLVTRDAVRVEGAALVARLRPRIVALRAEHPVFRSPGAYARLLGEASLNWLTAPIAGLDELISALLFGVLDLETVSGSGIRISAEGAILTNAHVVEEAESISARMEGSPVWHDCELVSIDRELDVAVVLLLGSFDGAEQPLVGRAPPRLGEPVYVLGFPVRGFETSPRALTVTRGIVSCEAAGAEPGPSRFQVDAATNAGSSGGGVFGADGALLGLIVEHGIPRLLEDQTLAIPLARLQREGVVSLGAAK